ncbi:MAG: sigma-70 family RNA polymerase sigma factor [Acidobacteriota bacterium]
MDDATRIERLLEGDPETVTEVRAWLRASFSPYRQLLAADLEDLEQDILISLSEALRVGKFQGQSTLRTYIRAYAHHKCLDALRSRRRRQMVDLEDAELPTVAPEAIARLDRADAREMTRHVLDAMPEGCRDLWQMIHEGLRYREMSDRLGVAEGALRARVLRCRRKAIEAREAFIAKKNGESA